MSVGLVVEIIGDASKLSQSLSSAEGDVGAFGKGIAGTAVKVAAVAGVVGIAAAGIAELTSAAAADRAEQEKLAAAIEAAGAATATSTAEVEAAIAAGQERAFTDSETRDALQSLVTATGDVTTATGLLAQAQDLARFAGVDLATAADAIAKAQAGSDGALRKLVPGLEKGATATDTLAAATARAAGQADLYAESSEGMQKRAGDSLGELGETIGEVFLPVLDAVIPALLPILKALGELVKAILPILIPLIKLLAGALKIAADVLVTIVQWLVKLVRWLGDAAGAVGDFLASINPLKNLELPSLPFLSASSSSAGPGSAGVSSLASAPGSLASGSSGITVNVFTTGDSIAAEQAVVRAMRRVTRLNGGVVPAVGWSG